MSNYFKTLCAMEQACVVSPNAQIVIATYGKPHSIIRLGARALKAQFPGVSIRFMDCSKPERVKPRPVYIIDVVAELP